MTGRHNERGLALVVVLWGIAALSLIAAAMLASSVSTARIGRNAWTELEVRTTADRAVQNEILSLFDPDRSHMQHLDGSPRDRSSGNTKITVTVRDESGRVDLNYASQNLLKSYFKAARVPDPQGLADRIVAWRSPANPDGAGAQPGEADTSHRARGGPFQSMDELMLVSGVTPELYRHLEPGLTIYSHHADFDTRTAPKEVLEVIPGMTAQIADATISAREPTFAAPGHTFTIVATATRGHTRSSRRAVILLSADPDRPYWIVDWH